MVVILITLIVDFKMVRLKYLKHPLLAQIHLYCRRGILITSIVLFFFVFDKDKDIYASTVELFTRCMIFFVLLSSFIEFYLVRICKDKTFNESAVDTDAFGRPIKTTKKKARKGRKGKAEC